MRLRSSLLFLVLLLKTSTGPAASLSVANLFSSNMILQRDQDIQVWGWAPAGEQVYVNFHGLSGVATADSYGRWQASLPALPADSVGQALAVSSSSGSFSFSNVVLGDIWLCSGQSNMEWSLEQSLPNGTADLAASNDPGLRILKVYHDIQTVPRADLPIGTVWKQSSPANNAGQWNSGTSGLAYYFAKQLRTDLGIPIGILESCWGGSSCEAWVSNEALAQEPALSVAVPSSGPTSAGDNHWPTGLYNGMIAPLAGFPIKGVLWDQGETNTGVSNGIQASDHQFLLPALIKDWRARWGSQFSFLTVQLQNMSVIIPNTTPPARESWADPTQPLGSVGWADVRWGHFKTLELPMTGMSVNIDLNPYAYESDSTLSYHPPNKKDFADRLLPWARQVTYGQTVDHSGPQYLSYTVEGPAIRIHFSKVLDQAGGALSTTDLASPRGFQIAASAGSFVWATASISGDTVLVSAPSVPSPARVRYAWHYNPVDPLGPIANLCNSAGILASPFQTEDPPKIRVSGNGIDIADLDLAPALADGTDFGAMDTALNATQAFVIHNDGRGTLNLSSGSLVDLATGNAADFSLILPPNSSIPPGASSSFQIRFQPGGIGLRKAELRIPNNDAPRSPYRFALRGTGTSAYSPTPTPNATATVTPTTGPTPCNEDYTFEGAGTGSVQGWAFVAPSTGTLSASATMPHDGAYALKASLNLNKSVPGTTDQVLIAPSTGYPRDFTGKTLHAWVWVPAGMSDAANPTGAFLYVHTGAGWAWSNSPWVNLPNAGGWTELTFDVSALPNIDVVQRMGIAVAMGASSPAWSGDIYLDTSGRIGGSCASSPTPSPTRTPSPSASPTALGTFTPSPVVTPTPTVTAGAPCNEDFSFEGTGSGSTEGWGPLGPTLGTLSASSTQPHDGSYSLKAAVSFNRSSGTSDRLMVGPASGYPRDYTGKTLHAWVWVPAGMSDATAPSGAFLFVQTGSTWAWSQSAWTDLPNAGGWVELTFNVSAVPNIDQVQAVGVLIGLGGSSPNWAGDVYVDTAGRIGGFCAAASPTPSSTPTMSATISPTPSASPAFTATLTPSPSPAFSATRTLSPSSTATPSATVTPSATATLTATPSALASATLTPAPWAVAGDLEEAKAAPNPQTGKDLSFALRSRGSYERVTLSLYTPDHKLCWRTELQGPWNAGWNQLHFGAPSGGLGNGVYFYRIQADLDGARKGDFLKGRIYILR